MTATAAPLIANVFGRKHTSLNGAWRSIVDPYENGYYDYRYEPSQSNYGLNQKPQSPSDRIEYDFDQSPTLKVPGDWNSQRLELSLYEGTVWYKTAFVGKRSSSERPRGAAPLLGPAEQVAQPLARRRIVTASVDRDPHLGGQEDRAHLGPGGLGGTADDNSYVCDKDTLTYKGSTHQDGHANFGVTLTRLKD